MLRFSFLFLVLLRLAVGWHFFYEGMLKYRSTAMGPTVTSRPFSSAGYFREAPGPLGELWRRNMGDPDQEALLRLIVKSSDDQEDPAADKPQDRMPPGLEKDWSTYVARFSEHYSLDPAQRAQAEAKLRQAEATMVDFLTYVPPTRSEDQLKDAKYATYTTEVTRLLPPSGEFKRRMSMAERIDEYRDKAAAVHEAGRRMWEMKKDTEGPRLRTLKTEAATMRAGLLKDVDAKTEELKSSLDKILTKEQKAEAPVPEPKANWTVEWVDTATIWGLMGIGVCLMAGLLTRTSAWLGVLFLLMTYLAVPPWPWLPTPPASEGNYLYVNKNVIELFALCVLGTTLTGRWFGVDRVLHCMRCSITGKKPQF